MMRCDRCKMCNSSIPRPESLPRGVERVEREGRLFLQVCWRGRHGFVSWSLPGQPFPSSLPPIPVARRSGEGTGKEEKDETKSHKGRGSDATNGRRDGPCVGCVSGIFRC